MLYNIKVDDKILTTVYDLTYSLYLDKQNTICLSVAYATLDYEFLTLKINNYVTIELSDIFTKQVFARMDNVKLENIHYNLKENLTEFTGVFEQYLENINKIDEENLTEDYG